MINKHNKMFQRLVEEESNKVRSHVEKNIAKYLLISSETNNQEINSFLKTLKIDPQEKVVPFQYYDGIYVKTERFEKDYQLIEILNSIFVQPNESYCKDFMLTGNKKSLEFFLINELNKGFLSDQDLNFLRNSPHLGL